MSSPDMIWYTCFDCKRHFTLADMTGEECPHCGHSSYHHYVEDIDSVVKA